MYDSSNFLVGFGSKNNQATENHRMVGFLLHREDVTAVDASVAAVTQIIDMSRSVNGRDNTIMFAPVRTVGAGTLTALLYAILPSNQAGAVLPTPIFIGALEQSGETGLIRFDNLPAAKYKLQITGVGASTWQIYVAYSSNVWAASG